MRDLNQAISLNSENAEAYLIRGLMYSTIEENAQGFTDLERAAKLFQEQGNTTGY